MAELERMLKAFIKSLENKHLKPCILESFLVTKLEKNHLNREKEFM
jgi:hypothetical protein